MNLKFSNFKLGTDRHYRFDLDRGVGVKLAFLLVLFSLCLSGCGAESAKWNVADAENLYDQGDLAGAVAALEEASRKAPNDENIKLHLALRYAENGQNELGLGLCDEYIKKHPEEVRGFRTRFSCHLFKGNFKDALADYKKSLSDHASRSSEELNNLAYFRGLANEEIDKAAIEIHTAITKTESHGNWGSPLRLPLQIRTVIAAGLISRHIDRHEVAIVHLNKKINDYDLEVASQTRRLKRMVAGETLNKVPFSKNVNSRLLEARMQVENQSTRLAAMLATRALVYEDMGEHDKADADRLTLDQLNFKFENIVRLLPRDFDCISALEESSMFLDTRGFVLGRQTWMDEDPLWSFRSSQPSPLLVSNYENALADLELAVLSAKLYTLAIDTSLYNTPEISAQIIETLKKNAKKNTAVLLHHRREVHLKGGNQEAAAKDQSEIDELGFNKCSLF